MPGSRSSFGARLGFLFLGKTYCSSALGEPQPSLHYLRNESTFIFSNPDLLQRSDSNPEIRDGDNAIVMVLLSLRSRESTLTSR